MIGIFDAIIGLFLWATGLCVGSFLNVVVYRLPRGLSVGTPRWSFCPFCETQLRTRDNLPLISWIMLRGRCRTCAALISVQYPLVESLTGLVFLLTYFLLFITKTRAALPTPLFPTDTLALIAWLVLVGALVACSAMDFVSYTLDTRVTDAALYVGLIALALWPRPEFTQQIAGAASTPLMAASLAALILSGVMLWLFPARIEEIELPSNEVVESAQPDGEAGELPPVAEPADASVVSQKQDNTGRGWSGRPARTFRTPETDETPVPPCSYVAHSLSQNASALDPEMAPECITANEVFTQSAEAEIGNTQKNDDAGWGVFWGGFGTIIFTLLALGLLVTIAIRPWSIGLKPQNNTEIVAEALLKWAAPVCLFAIFIAMVATNSRRRDADDDIHAAIEAEAPAARGVALRELLWLTPIMLAAVGAYLAIDRWAPAQTVWDAVTSWAPFDDYRGLGGYSRLRPVAMLAFSAHGAMLAAALGWALRIVFTLAFGREAYGAGDIFLMAAAGAAAGWDIAYLGFILACGLAAASWLVGLFSKRAAMMPFVPPLALGFLVALWLSAPAAKLTSEYRADLSLAIRERPALAQYGVGLLLVAGTLAVLVAKAMRQALEGPEIALQAEPVAASETDSLSTPPETAMSLATPDKATDDQPLPEAEATPGSREPDSSNP